MRDVLSPEEIARLDSFRSDKHPGAICVANYKGGVGKTTLVCLLGCYIAKLTGKSVLMFDIDPQCSLSLAVGFDPDVVSKTDLTIYNLVQPSKWTKLKKTNLDSYVFPVPDSLSPKGLFIIRGSFKVDELDIEIAKSLLADKNRRVDELFLYCKQMLNGYEKYDYVLIDCPPNKMFLTQAMLRASSYYLPVTIPDRVSVYGMPRLMRWVREIPKAERPKLLGYVLNAINRSGGLPEGKVYSQQSAEARLRRDIQSEFDSREKAVLADNPLIGQVPRLDIIARFLAEETKFSRFQFARSRSGQPSIDECLTELTKVVLNRIEAYNAEK